jgi:hypothetical protein
MRSAVGGSIASSRHRISYRSMIDSISPSASPATWSRNHSVSISASEIVASRNPNRARISARKRSAVRPVRNAWPSAGTATLSCRLSAAIPCGSTSDSFRSILVGSHAVRFQGYRVLVPYIGQTGKRIVALRLFSQHKLGGQSKNVIAWAAPGEGCLRSAFAESPSSIRLLRSLLEARPSHLRRLRRLGHVVG